MPSEGILVNRAPVMTLWAALVAERLGHGADEALTIGKAVASATAQTKGRRLGIYDEKGGKITPDLSSKSRNEGESATTIMGRSVTTLSTPAGVRAASKGQPIDPGSVLRYLEKAFGNDLIDVRLALVGLAEAFSPRDLAMLAYALYEQFRPEIPDGTRGWGAKGQLSLDVIRRLTEDARRQRSR